ncbi:hypothetical protein ECE50_029100 [Chitinophaga sp. Mgbs1]|uniref:Uncharacterized protein n=1 Tax=Chitinophaga solisilvae TaxID=1233460 RepID=A0A3S1JHK3_9BACT|nr:hypothetical protein [Chitinophaga solisilvae]
MKKKIAIGKKLAFNKATIASLNNEQQFVLAGGAIPPTKLTPCITGQEDTCPTIPFTHHACVRCMN